MKNVKKFLGIFIMIIVLIGLVSPINTQAASKVKINKTDATLYVGSTVNLKITGTKANVWRNLEGIDEFIKRLVKDLNMLIRALEIYLSEFISKIECKVKVPEITALNPDHVLSFNYTNTYEKIYGVDKDIEYDYIHGEVDTNKNIETCNLVLGIDEYLSDDRKNKDIEFVSFKKYYQRIYKQTGCKYLDWVGVIKGGYKEYQRKMEDSYAEIVDALKDGSFDVYPFQKKICSEMFQGEPPKHNLYVFGHSLDVTDPILLDTFL